MIESKESLRSLLKEQRGALTEAERLTEETFICRQIVQSEDYQKATTIGIYAPCKSEFRLDILWKRLYDDRKMVYLPKVLDASNRYMELYRVNRESELSIGAFGIREPASREAADRIDLLIVPGVGFDTQGYRLGYGGGFYDTYLLSHTKKIGITYGVGYHCQLVEDVYPASHDQKLDRILIH